MKARERKCPIYQTLTEEFQVNPAHVTAYLLTLWGISKNVINAALYQYAPAEEHTTQFNVTTALYIASGVVSRQEIRDGFALAEWDVAYLQRVGGVEVWEEFSAPPTEESNARHRIRD